MTTFGLICEGATDQKVISNILDGVFETEVPVNTILPLRDATDLHRIENYSNWLKVIEYCESGQLAGALTYNDYVIIHIDTDVSDEVGFGVSKLDENNCERSPKQMVEAVKDFLIDKIGTLYPQVKDRLIFAVAVHSIECWILPLYSNRHKGKIKSCLDTLNRELSRKGCDTISEKKPRYYDELTKAYRKKKALDTEGQKNPSLYLFLEEIESKSIE